jgi:hypothetical protein
MDKRSEMIRIRDKYFSDRNWELKKCSCCSAEYFAKKHKNLELCNSHACSGYHFVDVPSPNKFIDLAEGIKTVLNFFTSKRYVNASPIGIVRNDERTLFASAAGQIFDDFIYGIAHTDDLLKFIMVQPVIRLQGLELVGELEGISSSFLHSAVVQWNASPKDHFLALDSWLDFFSSIGLYAGDLTFKISASINDWSGKDVTAESLKINYRGLEIGIANYFVDIPISRGIGTMSDVGIGAERLLWVVNKSRSYFDAIGPLTFLIKDNTILLDSIRTMVLMAGSGVVPYHKNQGSKFRLIANKISNPLYTFPLAELTTYYYDQWSRYIKFDYPLQTVKDAIKKEVDRNANLNLNRILERDDPHDVSHEDFLRSLARSMSMKKLITAIGNGDNYGK